MHEGFFKDVIKEAHEIVKENNQALDNLINENKTKEEIANLIMYSTGNDLLSFLKEKIDDKKTYLTYLAKEREELENKKEINDDLVDSYAKKLNLFKKWFDLKKGGQIRKMSGVILRTKPKKEHAYFLKMQNFYFHNLSRK